MVIYNLYFDLQGNQKLSFSPQLISTLVCLPVKGTRIIYDRKFLLDRRNSPIAQTPPAHLPVIRGVTSQTVLNENRKNEANKHTNSQDGKPGTGGGY